MAIKREEVEVEEGLQQKLRKIVPGYAKRQINKKMDDQKFGRTDVDKDANYYRYKKLLDQANEEVEPVNEISKDLAHSYFKQRYAQTGATRQDKPKDMPRATHDKRLQGMDRARRRLTTTLTLPKGVDPSEGGKYTADSVQHDNENTIVEVKLSAAARLQRALQKA